MSEGEIIIRASTMPEYQDCARRAAAKTLKTVELAGRKHELLKDRGFSIRETKRSIGALIGSASHKGFEHLLNQVKNNEDLDDYETASHVALEHLQKAIADRKLPEIEHDDTTPMGSPYLVTLEKIMREWYYSVLPDCRPVLIEEEKACDGGTISGGGDNWQVVVSTHVDSYDETERIDDHKTGTNEPHPWTQGGTYVLVLRQHGYVVKSFRMNWVKRVGRTTPQPDAKIVDFDADVCADAALAEIKRFKRDIKDFLDTNDPSCFQANPGSITCTEVYCPVWGSNFCTQWRKK